jgi:hypothetical protein
MASSARSLNRYMGTRGLSGRGEPQRREYSQSGSEKPRDQRIIVYRQGAIAAVRLTLLK